MTTVIIGFGVTAMMQLLAAGTVSNVEGAELTTAINLASNVREISLGMEFRDPQTPDDWTSKEGSFADYDDLTDLDGETLSPPRDVNRESLSEYASWAQEVTVSSVPEDGLTGIATKAPDDPVKRVTVAVTHNEQEIYRTSWFITDPD